MSQTATHTLLIIEDDHETRVSLRNALENEGWFVFSASNGVDGLALLNRIKRPCVILLDLMMPLMDGEEFLKARSKSQDLADIPVVVMSAMLSRGAAFGDAGFLPKPVDLAALIAAINKACLIHPNPSP